MMPRASSSWSIRRPGGELDGGRAAHHPPGAVAGRAERLRHAPRLAREDPAGRPHAAGDDHRLADRLIGAGDLGMTGREGPGRPLAMDADLLREAAADVVVLELGDVVGDVVDQVQPQRLPGDAEDPGEDLAGLVGEQLAVAPGIVGRRAHRPQVGLPLGAVHRGAGQLPVGEREAVLLGRPLEDAEVVVADLVAEPARARVDQDGDLPLVAAP